MKIVESDKFKKELNNILAFIAKDSVSAKNYFSKSLKDAILCIDNMPYKFRKSTLFNDENIRDFIFKKYVIPYYIDSKNDKILLITIYKNNLFKPLKNRYFIAKKLGFFDEICYNIACI